MKLAAPVFLFLSAFALHAAEPSMEKQDLFTANELGYKVYHIPGIVVTAKGTVLAWCEARKKGGDWDQIDVLMRRSTDNGKTWTEPVKISQAPEGVTKNPFSLAVKGVNPKDVTCNNPVFIADRDGTVHGLYCVEYMRCFYIRSGDEGANWSKPVEITKTFEDFHKSYDWKVLATGPDHAIQTGKGRLVVPIWLSTGTGGNAHRPSVTAIIYSDDQGKTWHAGEIAIAGNDEIINPNETVVVELANGGVMLNARSESKAHRRLVTVSKDGATGWSKPKFDDSLWEPICMGSIVRFSTKDNGGKNRILFCNPDNLSRADGKEQPGKNRDRKNVSVKLSYDEAQTWPVNKAVEPGPSGYSDIAVAKDGTILCFYGRGDIKDFGGYAFNHLTLARFNLEWLTDGKDSATAH